MTTSPYDSLPSGADNIVQKRTENVGYVEVDLDVPANPTPKPPVKPALKTVPFEPLPQYSRSNIKNFCGTKEYILPFEESLLVPDTMPDMQRVLFAEGRADPAQPEKTSYSKDDFLAGDITVYTVYYPVPSGTHSPASGPAAYMDCPIDVVKSTIPFKTDKCWDDTTGDDFKVSLTVKNITAEMINERKFALKGTILIKITETINKELKVFKSVDDDRLITSSTMITSTGLAHETTETTEISQDITIREGQPSPIKILKEKISISEVHRQITSGKLVINGTIHSHVLYLGETDDGSRKAVSLSNKTDFTQFIVMDKDADPSLIKLAFNSGDLKVTIENKDKLLLQGNVITHIQVYENKPVKAISDAYHKSRDIVFDVNSDILSTVKDTVHGEISSREVINLTDNDKKPARLLCGSCSITSIEASAEKGRVVIEGSMPVKLLALDDDDMPFVIEHPVPIRGSLESSSAGSNSALCIDAAVKDFWFDDINNRQIEINTTLSISIWVCSEETFCTIENLRFAETKESAKKPSMAIYVVGSGDTLWDIAKRYKTDILTLAELNGIDPEKPLPEGAKLFIVK